MRHLRQQCIEALGNPPREFSRWDRLTYLRVPKPLWLWLNPSDDLKTLFRNTGVLFSDGIVVWGHIIQANTLMFESGTDNCPGDVVYSIHDTDHVEPEYLQQVAHALFDLKGTAPTDPELLPIAEYLTDEMIRVFGLPVPRSVSPSFRCMISTTYFVRKHLPNRRLCTPLLPIVVNPRKPHVVLPLPERYWPRELLKWWV